MAASTPLTTLVLDARSVADDLGYVALNDLATALTDIAADYRVIGGHMVTMLAARWQLGVGLYRETGDVDLGIPPIVARDQGVVSRLKGLSYVQIAGNRFARRLSRPVMDVWRCLEIAFAAGLKPADFVDGVRADSAEVIRTLFGSRRGAGMAVLAAEQHLSAQAADERFTRVQALMARVLGPT